MPSCSKILRETVIANPSNIYIIGNSFIHNVLEPEEGLPLLLEGLPNVIQVPVKRKTCNARSQASFFDNATLEYYRTIAGHFLDKVPLDKMPDEVIWHAKIGLGCSRLKELAPANYDWLVTKLRLIYGD